MRTVHPAYRRALSESGRMLARCGRIDAVPPGTRRLVVQVDSVSLALLVDDALPPLVADARHDGATGLEAALLDRFCAVLAGRPLYEAVHHGVVRLEADLRDPTVPLPVDGIVLPQNADPIFELPLRLARALRELVGPSRLPPDQRGRWEDRPAPAWLALPPGQQAARVQAALDEAVPPLATVETPPRVVEVRDGFRVVIAVPSAEDRRTLGPALMRIERALQRTLDPRLELLLESAADRNRRTERLIKISGT
jgi:hypothetical protein